MMMKKIKENHYWHNQVCQHYRIGVVNRIQVDNFYNVIIN
jgi:hypothetical protein